MKSACVGVLSIIGRREAYTVYWLGNLRERTTSDAQAKMRG